MPKGSLYSEYRNPWIYERNRYSVKVALFFDTFTREPGDVFNTRHNEKNRFLRFCTSTFSLVNKAMLNLPHEDSKKKRICRDSNDAG